MTRVSACERAQWTTCDRAGFVLRRRYRCTGVCRGRQVDRNCRRRRRRRRAVVMFCAAAGGERAGKGMRVARRSAASLAGPPRPLDKKYYYDSSAMSLLILHYVKFLSSFLYEFVLSIRKKENLWDRGHREFKFLFYTEIQ